MLPADPKIYSMAEALRLACLPGVGKHAPPTVNLVRSLLHVDCDAAKLPSNDGRLAIHLCCEAEEHTASSVEVLHMLIGAYREGVMARKGHSDKGRLPFHYLVVRTNHNEVRSLSVLLHLTTGCLSRLHRCVLLCCERPVLS